MTQPQRAQLRDFVVEHFSREELITFCADYFRDFFEDYEGTNLSKSSLAGNLIEHCEHRELTDKLRANLQRVREKPYLTKFERVPVVEMKAQPRNPRQVFLSHAHEDVDFALRLAKDLREAGLSVWMTPDSIQPGEQWASAIERGLDESKMFIVLLTPNSVKSRWVKKETLHALEHDDVFTIAPVLLKTCDVNQLSKFLTQTQYINFERDYGRGLEALCGTLGVQSVAMRAALQAAKAQRQHEVAEREQQRRLVAEQERQRLTVAERERQQREVAEVKQLQVENERLTQAAEERGRQKVAAAQRERLRQENERLKREAAQQPKPKPAPAASKDAPQISRRALLLGAGGAAGVGAVAWVVGQLNTTPRAPAAPTYTAQPAATTAPLPAGLPATFALTSPLNMDFVLIPAGPFLMGSDKAKDGQAYDNELPQHTVTLGNYYIGKYEVTNKQWATFAQTTKRSFSVPDNKAKHPVVNINWHDAIAFCEWLSRESGRTVTLPSEAEWEKAARGTDGRIYPWGNDAPTKDLLNFNGTVGDTTPVGQYSPKGDSPFGCADMAGNVWEWTRSLEDFKYPYVAGDGRENLQAGEDMRRVVRGGSWGDDQDGARAAFRSNLPSSFRGYFLGLRVVVGSAPV